METKQNEDVTGSILEQGDCVLWYYITAF